MPMIILQFLDLKSSISYLLSSFYHSFKEILYFIAGGIVTYVFNVVLKNREIKIISKNNSQYISLMLRQQLSSLEGMKKELKETKETGKAQKWIVCALPVAINQETIEKILSYQRFYNYQYAYAIQLLTLSEITYRKCFQLIDQYNECVNNILILNASVNTEMRLKQGYLIEINSLVQAIQNSYDEFCKINKDARCEFDKLCQGVFGKLFKPVIEGDIVKATDLLKVRQEF